MIIIEKQNRTTSSKDNIIPDYFFIYPLIGNNALKIKKRVMNEGMYENILIMHRIIL